MSDCSFSICGYIRTRINRLATADVWADWIREDWGW